MNEKAVTGLLGLAQRAGQVVVGSERSLDHIRRKATGLMLIDRSASVNTCCSTPWATDPVDSRWATSNNFWMLAGSPAEPV